MHLSSQPIAFSPSPILASQSTTITDGGHTPRDNPMSRQSTPSPTPATSQLEPSASAFQPQHFQHNPFHYPQQQQQHEYYQHSQSDLLSDSPHTPSAGSPPEQYLHQSSILRDHAQPFASDQQQPFDSYTSPLGEHNLRSSFAFARPSRSVQNGMYGWEDQPNSFVSHESYATPQQQPQPPISQHTLDNRPPFEVDINAPAKQSHLINQIRANSLSMASFAPNLSESQQIPGNRTLQQLQAQQVASAQAQAIINNLPTNLSSREYIAALQQVHQAQNLASQVSAQLLHGSQPVVSTIPGGHGGANNISATTTAPLAQEEISTIFVVGFPDDMQEREFQNMFTFSSGFEAATLKIPNKEHASYGVNANGASNPQGQASRPGFQSSAYSGAAGDPYNHLTVNSGGVVLDSRELSSAAASGLWNGLATAADVSDMSSHLAAAPPPRRQIIGFAKFKTREQALEAREVLQGRRVDAEKGAMLKAEMAKKNLHTKRGVGPLSNGGNGGNGSGVNGLASEPSFTGLNGLHHQLSQLAALGNLANHPLGNNQFSALGGLSNMAGGESLTQHQRDLAALGAMGLNGMQRDRERERDRGDRERERDVEVERESRTRIGSINHLSAYDAFHSVPAPQPSSATSSLPARPTTYPALPSTGSASLAPGITPAGPSAKQNGIMSPVDGVGPRLASFSFSSGAPGAGSGLLSLHSDNVWSTNFGQGLVDPLDASSPSTADSQAASSSLHVPMSSNQHTLSRRPSSILPSTNSNSPPESISSSFSPNGMQMYEQVSPSTSSASAPLGPSGQQPSHTPTVAVSPPPLHHQSSMHSLYGSINGNTNGNSSGVPSSTGSASPPEEHQYPAQQGYSVNGTLQRDNTTPGSGNAQSSVAAATAAVYAAYESEIARAMAGLSMSTHQGMTSPQIPSPGSGGSASNANANGTTASSVRPNAADQNPPINTLYVGNLPSTITTHPNALEDNLRNLFSRCAGYRKLCFRQKSNGPMCFVEFDDVPCATKALNDLYGNTLSGLVKGGIRLSYSKNPLGVRTASVSTGGSNGSSLNSAGANLFNAAAAFAAGIPETSAVRFSHHHLLTSARHSLPTSDLFSPNGTSSLSNLAVGRGRQDSIDVLAPIGRSRQESVDLLSNSYGGNFTTPSSTSPSSFATSPFGSRSFSPPSSSSSGGPISGLPPRGIQHQSLIDGLSPFHSFSSSALSADHRDSASTSPFQFHQLHQQQYHQTQPFLQQTPSVSVSVSPSPGPGVEA